VTEAAAPAPPVHTDPASDAEGAADAEAGAATRTPLTTLPGGEGAPTLMHSGLKMAGGLLTVLALILAGMTVLRRVRGTAFGGAMPIRVLASASVGGRQNVVVVEVEGRRLVVGVGPSGMELLADLAQAPSAAEAPGTGPAGPATAAPVPSPRGSDTRFARILKAAGRKADPQAEAVARATRDLARHVRRLRERAV
jgi:flagellar protein FliO/FliZ